MKINVTKTITDLDGNDVVQNVPGPTGDDGHAAVVQETMTVRTVLVNSILLEDPKNPTPGMDKVKLFNLAKRIHDCDEVSLAAEEITLIKPKVLTSYAVMVAGQVVTLLEGE